MENPKKAKKLPNRVIFKTNFYKIENQNSKIPVLPVLRFYEKPIHPKLIYKTVNTRWTWKLKYLSFQRVNDEVGEALFKKPKESSTKTSIFFPFCMYHHQCGIKTFPRHIHFDKLWRFFGFSSLFGHLSRCLHLTISHEWNRILMTLWKMKIIKIVFDHSRNCVPTSFRWGFSKKISKWQWRKNSWKFVYILAKQYRSPFNLTNFLRAYFQFKS